MNAAIEVRKAEAEDAADLVAIYNQGIDERTATFNTNHVAAKEMEEKIVNGTDKHPVLVAVMPDINRVIGWASISPYSSRPCYCGVGEVSIYVHKQQRAKGAGKLLLQALIEKATEHGYWKLIARIFESNKASKKLFKEFGFRDVGVLEKHSKLDDKWLDVLEIERLIPANIT
jgi:phosphinothricin acetyltransferase